jgi:hypothetical protein
MNTDSDIISLGSVAGIRPVFVSSLYRSSSTFLAGVISCHPDYQATSSSVKFLRFCLGRYGDVAEPANRERLVLETFARVNTRWKIRFDVDAVLRNVARRGATYAVLYDEIMSQILVAYGAGGAQWIEKIAVMWSRIPDFLRMFPDGKAIHVLRDPRSVTASYKKMTNEPGFTYLDAAFNTIDAIQSIRRFRTEFGADRVMLLRSEDVALQPEASIRSVCAFLGIEFSDRMMDPGEHGRIIGEDWRENTSFRGRIEGFPAPSTRWREFMTPAETMFVEMVCQPYLAENGYQADDHMPDESDWAQMYRFLEDPFLRERFRRWLHTGRGSEGYRTDPYMTEMKIVFPERFKDQ